MTAKNCRHVSQALRLPEFRRALKAHESLACQLCAVPTTKQNSRARTGSVNSSKKSSSSPAPQSPSLSSLSSEDVLQSWVRSAAWEDLCICVTCGFIGCLSGNHFSQHFQANPKHFVGFHAGAKTFWCCPCKHEIVDGKAKVEDARRECQESFDEIAAKQQRKIKNRVVIAPPKAPVDRIEPEEVGAEDAENGVDAGPLRASVAVLTALKKKKSSRVVDREVDTTTESPAPDVENGGDVQQATRKEKRGKEKKESRKSKALEKKNSSSSQNADASAALMVPSVLGFTNLGNTCYFNAATQALLTVAHYFPEHVHLDEALEKPNSPILMTFSMLHETIKKKARRRSASSAERDTDPKQKSKKGAAGASGKSDGVLTVAPLLKELRKKFVQFRGSYQQDAHELFMSFLWAIDEEADPPAMSAETSTVSSSSKEKNDSKADQENDVEGIDSDDEDSDDDGDDEQKQIFVKTETGETISMQVPKHATVQEVQHLLAKRLNLNEDDMVLDHGARPSSRQSTALRTQKSFSKLNFARNLFGGELTTVITCQACGNQSQTLEDAFQLSVPVPGSATPRSLTTIDCLKNFMSETQLLVSAKNGYDCEKCSRGKKSLNGSSSTVSTASTVSSASSGSSSASEQVVLRDATMRLVVSQLPRVLVIHIKRLGRLKKITQHIQFDSFMDMAPYIDSSKTTKQSTFYELVAVVVHMGNKRSGHYVAYVSRSRKRDLLQLNGGDGNNAESSPQDQQQMEQDSDDDFDPRAEIHTSENPSRSWYYISDTVVKRVAFEQVLQCEAYMLFYRQLPPEQQREVTVQSVALIRRRELQGIKRRASCRVPVEPIGVSRHTALSMSASIDGNHAPLTDDDNALAKSGGVDVAAKVVDAERVAAASAVAEDAVAAARRKEYLERKCGTLGDSEEVCAQLVGELVEDMFMEMQVLEENERSFVVVARFTIDQVFDSLRMGGAKPNESLDRVAGVDGAIYAAAEGMQQILKLDDALAGEGEEPGATGAGSNPQQRPNRNRSRSGVPLEFLRQLSSGLEKQQSVAQSAFIQFPATTKPRGGSAGGGGGWVIPASELSAFLQHFIAVSNLSVLPSAVQFVVEANRGTLEKKQKAPVRLSLPQIQICVQGAFFAAEDEALQREQEEEEAKARAKKQQQSSSVKESAADTDGSLLRHVFQTEVLQSIANSNKNQEATKPTQPNGEKDDDDDDDDLPLACYLDETDRLPPSIDRNAPGSVSRKPTASSKQGLARKVLLAMKKEGPATTNSKWLALRTKVLVKDSTTTEMSIEADMSLSVAATQRQSPPMGFAFVQQPHPPQPPKKKSFATLAAGPNGKNATTNSTAASTGDKKPPGGGFTIEPDAAALSNIFSLGTPRQLNVDELARRNDILALLEREEIKNERRMANASIAAMTMPVSSSLSETDKTYQAYVAANSVIIAPLSQAAVDSPTKSGSGELLAAAATSLSPKRPEKKNASHSHSHHRELSIRTKFEIEREPPVFVVSEGNAHVRDELNALEMALCSPIKWSKGRGTREQQRVKPPAPPAAAPVTSVNNGNHAAGSSSPIKVSTDSYPHDPHRPIQTASSHLSQLETSRLAVGVCAVVRGVEKRGPKRSPSRKSRLKLHNYNSGVEAIEADEDGQELENSPPSPIKRQQQQQEQQYLPPSPNTMSNNGRFLPLIPPVSPIKASPHRKHHVSFQGSKTSSHEVSAAAVGDSEDSFRSESRRPAKQPVWEKKMSSPPRVRNRFFAPGSMTKPQKFQSFLFQQHHHVGGHGRGDDDGVGEYDDDVDDDEGTNLFKTRIEAPRRSYLPVHDQA